MRDDAKPWDDPTSPKTIFLTVPSYQSLPIPQILSMGFPHQRFNNALNRLTVAPIKFRCAPTEARSYRKLGSQPHAFMKLYCSEESQSELTLRGITLRSWKGLDYARIH